MPVDDNEELADEFAGVVLPEEGVVDLTDQLTEYMTEIELGGLSDIIGQVLDDFLDQSGGMPENLRDDEAFDQIASGQLAVTLAYQLGRLEGRSPQIVERLIRQAVEKWEARPVGDALEISEQDMRRPKELVYPRLRRMEYAEMDDDDYLDEEDV
jgi:hypothetical protein